MGSQQPFQIALLFFFLSVDLSPGGGGKLLSDAIFQFGLRTPVCKPPCHLYVSPHAHCGLHAFALMHPPPLLRPACDLPCCGGTPTLSALPCRRALRDILYRGSGGSAPGFDVRVVCGLGGCRILPPLLDYRGVQTMPSTCKGGLDRPWEPLKKTKISFWRFAPQILCMFGIILPKKCPKITFLAESLPPKIGQKCHFWAIFFAIASREAEFGHLDYGTV